jgi:16S rRNA (adenine1518-N6/adenine1519-N6)-dimethyltransferase
MDSQNPSPRQTLSYIRNLLQSRRLIPKNKMGQNFLIDLNLVDLVVQTAQLDKTDSVLEVGTGTGSLTSRLSDQAGWVVSVELDRHFHEMATELLTGRANVHLIQADILRTKNELTPEVLQTWDNLTNQHQLTKRKLVANLPYAVATPVIANLLLAYADLDRMVVMIQWEVAERLVAEVSTKSYGALALLMQALADVQIVRRLGPSVFWPQPEVDSAIVCIKPNATKRSRVPDPQKFRAFLRDLYTHRKNLRQSLVGWPSGRKEKKEVDTKLAELNIDGTLRAESLDLDTHLRLCSVFG